MSEPEAGGSGPVAPAGDVYDWLQRGLGLIAAGDAAAAVALLDHAATAEPDSPAVREALARAQYDAGYYAAARESFAWIVERDPSDDYAHFGLGLAARRSGDVAAAVEHFALAAAMRPSHEPYERALRAARAALAAGA